MTIYRFDGGDVMTLNPTDAEVIKALECCSGEEDGCDGCPYFAKPTMLLCTMDIMSDALDLIKRQKAEIDELRKRTHGLTHTRLYKIWKGMRQRCFSEKHKDYPNYGGRGISICDEWSDFKVFYDWSMANGYSDGLTIDRIDVNGNYEPSNCRWVGWDVQSKNRRFTKLTHNGETHTIEEWSKIICISNSGIRYRIQQNYPIDKILSPKKKGDCNE